ncbi:MAG: hypothetical protein JWM81_427 [Candidatus Saccharibacteria bacterium]|nr:hypothetical protein [Candidatus Saccharibacteria bacterium]
MKHGVQKSFLSLVLFALTFVFFSNVLPAKASATINPQISFQGKITNPDGTNIANNSYSIRFRLYTDPTADATNTCAANTCKWEETKSVTITDGIFQTALGDTTALPGSVDFNSSALYLGIKVTTDAEMTPRVRFTASPYAFNSEKVGGLTAAQLVQLTPGSQQTGTINVSGSITTGSTLAVQGANAVTLGSTTNVGAILFQDGTVNNRTVTLNVAALAASYSLTLPTAAPTINQCLQAGASTASLLVFGTCSTLQTSYNGSGVTSPQILLSAANGGFEIQDAASTVGSLFSVANNGGGTSYFIVTAGGTSVTGSSSASTSVLTPLVDTSSAATLSLGTGTANALTLGKFGVVTSAPGGLAINSGTNVPTADQVTIANNSSSGVTTAGVNALNVNYKGGAAAVESAGVRIDYAPGTTSGGTWSGMRIVAGATGAVAGVNSYGIKLEGPTSQGAGNEVAVEVATGWDIGLDLQSGGIQMADMSTDPTTPAAGNLRVYSRVVSGRSMLSQLSSSGVSYAFQPSLFQQNVMLVTPGGTAAATLNVTGGQTTTTGTLSTSIAGTEAAGGMASYTSAATAGTPAGFAGANNQYFRGSVANGADGFFYFARVNLSDATLANYTSTTTGARLYFGMTDQTMAVMGASNTPTGNFAGFQFAPSRDGGVMQFTTRDGTTQTVASTTLTLASSKTYDFYIYMKPRDTTVYYRIDNLTDGTVSLTGSKTTNLPTATVAMKPMVIIAPISAAARSFSFQRMYVESDR